MSDELLERIRKESTSWLLEQIAASRRLIHKSGQLLRGSGSADTAGLRAALWTERESLKLMEEELGRRKGDIR